MNVRYFILAALCVIPIIVTAVIAPIPQDLNYHIFSDSQEHFGIPNFWNVLSNLPYIAFGVFGLTQTLISKQNIAFGYLPLSSAFFIGLTLSGLGSAYYHYAPSNESLVWDRLPMTVAFMAFFTTVLSLHFSLENKRYPILIALITFGATSVYYWAYTENIGKGDLRPYAVIQFLPIILIPAIMLMFKSARYDTKYIGWIIGVYVLAKATEHFDSEIDAMLGFSGHSTKHIVSAFAGLFYLKLTHSIQVIQKSVTNE